MTGSLKKVRETRVVNATCPVCGENFEVGFNPSVDGSFYHAIKNDGTKTHRVGAIHMRSERSLKCPYCEHKFVEKREWR